MSKDPFQKLQSSQTLEELIADNPAVANQNWLISYLDVFVLVLMFIITLIALSDFSIETESKTTHTTSLPTIPPKPVLPQPEPTDEKPIAAPIDPSAPHIAPPIELPTPAIEDPTASEQLSESKALAVTEAPVVQPEPTKPAPEQITEPQTPIKESKESVEQQLSEKIEELGLNESVALKVTDDYAQLEIQNKILFESSQANLTDNGQHLLDDLATLLKQAVGLIFIEGHTDNRPIKTAQFPSNWELGSARATSVLHYLTTRGIDSSRMRAVTYADTQPIADNDTAEGREMNRRVSILIKVREQDVE
ncbi:MAG: hypothetical protein Kow0065_19060 [Methylomicrobium sp.]